MRIGIIGGAFDPITIGHLQMAQSLIGNSRVSIDQVWLLPCYQSLSGKQMASGHDRITMCQLAIADMVNPIYTIHKKIRVCDYEIRHQSTGSTEQIWQELMIKYNPDNLHEFYFVIGEDNARRLDDDLWPNSQRLKQIITFIVVPRDVLNADKNAWYFREPHIFLSEYQSNSVSSTLVKKDLMTTQKSAYLTKSVLNYILAHKLYT